MSPGAAMSTAASVCTGNESCGSVGTGTGTGSGSYLVSSDGRYLGGQWEITSALQLSGSFSPQPVPITITQSTKVSILP